MKNLKYVKLFDNFTTEESKNSVKFKITDRFYKDMNMSYSSLQPENDTSIKGYRLDNGVWHLIGYSHNYRPAEKMSHKDIAVMIEDDREPWDEVNTHTFYFAKWDKNKMQIDLAYINSNSEDGLGFKDMWRILMYSGQDDRTKFGDLEKYANRYDDLQLDPSKETPKVKYFKQPSKFESLEPGQVDDMDRFIVA